MIINSRRAVLINTIRLTSLTVFQGVLSVAANASQTEGGNALKNFFDQRNNNAINGITLRHRNTIATIYERRNFQPLWSENSTPTFTSKSVLKKLRDAHLAGLQPTKYYSRLLNQLADNATSDHLLQYDLVMTDSLYSYFDDIAHGNLRQRSNANWKLQSGDLNVESIAGDFFTGHYSFQQTLQRLEPTHSRYHGLLSSLNNHLNMSTLGDWTKVPAGRPLHLGESHQRVVLLKQRLQESGDLHFTNYDNNSKFDVATTAALIQFQGRHGLDPDGVLGSMTLAELNVPLDQRISQIEVNLDRWRWLARTGGHSSILVNLPGYDMELNINDRSALRMKVVVGKTKKRTPLFSDVMEHLVIKPSWYVPKSIAREILEKEAAKPGYIERNNFEVISTSSNTPVPPQNLGATDKQPDNFVESYRLRQRPGKNNALGNIKFMFPNRYNIYLHDTNAKGLFAKVRRAFSHGCIRLEKPFDLATTLLQTDGRSDADIKEFFAANSTKKIHIRTPIQVHLTYQTAWNDDSGRTHFRADIYRHDKGTHRDLKRMNTTYANAEGAALSRSGVRVASSNY